MRCPECGREVNEGAAVCRHCGFAFDPALIDASREQPAPRRKSGFTNQHSIVAPPASSEDASFDGARTDASEPPARTASTGDVDGDDAEPDVDVFATQPAGPPAAALDEFRDLSHDVTERGPARDVEAPQDIAATVVHDMASALAAYGLRDTPSPPPPSEEPVERTLISPPPTHAGSSSSSDERGGR